MINRVTSNGHIFKILVCSLISLSNIVYFLHKFDVSTSIDDAFYDADAARTLSYVSDPKNAISSIRPLLYVITWYPHLISKVFSPYIAWVILNVTCLIITIWLTSRTIAQSRMHSFCVILLFVNFSTLCWTLIPDTFLLSVTFFTLAISVYGDGANRLRVIGSGIIAAGSNLFLLVPWCIAHIFLSRKSIINGVMRSIEVAFIMFIMAIAAQYFSRFRSDSPAKLTESLLKTDETQKFFPTSSQQGLLDSVGFLGSIHSPLLGTVENLVMYLSSPWTVGYHYTSALLAVNSPLFPFFVLAIASGLSFLSFSGLYQMRNRYRRFTVFCVSLEIGTCLLFLTYGFHPVLYSPFLLVTRISGISFYILNGGKFFYQSFLAINLVSGATVYLVF